MSNRSQQQTARALANVTPGLKYTTALRQVMGAGQPTIPVEHNAGLGQSVVAGHNAASLQSLFAENNRTNKSLWHENGSRTRPTPSIMQPFLQLGDVVSFYAGAKHQWTVANQSENFTILTDEDDGKAVYTIIDWRNGWRGPHSSWGFGTTTDEERVLALAALESEELELSIRNALYLDIKTVRRNGKLIVRKYKPSAAG